MYSGHHRKQFPLERDNGSIVDWSLHVSLACLRFLCNLSIGAGAAPLHGRNMFCLIFYPTLKLTRSNIKQLSDVAVSSIGIYV